MKKKKLLERSQKVQEVLSIRPSFIVRWGITIILIILLLVSIICWFISYPDIIITKAKLNTINAPKEVVARIDGKIVKINTKENNLVTEGQILGYMESIAEPKSIINLLAKLTLADSLFANNRLSEVVQCFPTNAYRDSRFNLGELQPNYQVFIQTFTNFKDYITSGFYLHKKEMLEKDVANIQKLYEILTSQKKLLEQDITLSNENFAANELLAKEKIISPVDYRNEKSKLIAKQILLPQINASIVSNESQLNEKKKEISELENQILIQKNLFIQALLTLKSQLQAWQYKFELKAPVTGILSFTGFFQENQEIKIGQKLFYIQPPNSNYFIELMIPQYNFGKVKLGQEVLLRFQAYPFEQFGSVLGKIDHINITPTDSGYLAKASLTNGLNTNYKRQLQFRSGLIADAYIITENRGLLERIFENIIKRLKRNS